VDVAADLSVGLAKGEKLREGNEGNFPWDDKTSF